MTLVENQLIEITLTTRLMKSLDIDGNVGEIISLPPSKLPIGSSKIVKFKCDNCGSIFESVYKNRVNSKHHYCKKECKHVHQFSVSSRVYTSNKIKVNCKVCSKDIYKTKSQITKNKSGNSFCSLQCVGKYNAKIRTNKIKKLCEICNKEYTVIPARSHNSVTCSVECQRVWQSVALVGEQANNFKKSLPLSKRVISCDLCNCEFTAKSPYKLSKSKDKFNFCSIACKKKWMATVYTQSDEFKEFMRTTTTTLLSESKLTKEVSNPQKILNRKLNQMGIAYINEYNCKYYCMDAYLEDSGLMIEVMGTYWHCDPRKYNVIKYENQYNRIKKDRAKESYVRNKYGVNILYLWEYDLINNIENCEKLIKLYIESNGNLANYHSFNFGNKSEIVPYQNYDSIDLPVNYERIGRKRDLTKWVKFNCDTCNKEVEQLKSRYIKNKNHYCSVKCKHKN